MKRIMLIMAVITLTATAALAVPSLVEEVREGVHVIRDDAGTFGGWSLGVTHMSKPEYKAKKVLDLSNVPPAVWDKVKDVRLSLAIIVRDYSFKDNPPANGLDEAFEVVVNGTVHRFPTNCGAKVYMESRVNDMGWFDFPVPKSQLVRGVNEIIVSKAEGPKYDDYLYLGIDNSRQRGNSWVAFDGVNWTQDKLTIPGGNGEYMVRLYLLTEDLNFNLNYTPGAQYSVDDPTGLLTYVGARGAERDEQGLTLQPGQSLRLEWLPADVSNAVPLAVKATVKGSVEVAVLDEEDKPRNPVKGSGQVELKLTAADNFRSTGVLLKAQGEPLVVQKVTIAGARSYHPEEYPVNMAPSIAAPACGPKLPPNDKVTCQVAGKQVTLSNGRLRCRFETGPRLKLASLYNAITKTEMVRQPDALWLFWVMVGEQRFAGSRDFHLKGLKATKTGFTAELALPQPALRATLTVNMEREGLRLGLNLVNGGSEPVDFKLAFPHLAGLGVSRQMAWDYYFYPWGGGVISDRPASIRRGYGDYEAMYQVMDIFSPSQGGGLYLRVDDKQGWHKIFSLRKHVRGETEFNGDQLNGVNMRVKAEYRTPNPLEQVPGTAMSADYLRRSRPPGGSFAPADAVLAAHAGGWQQAMQAYADWAHRAWKWRPYPSRLKSVRNMMAAGWGQGILFKDGKYRTDIIQPPKPGIGRTMTDCIELMSWWDWSPLGPFMTPFDKLEEVLTPAQIKMWEPYFVIDPVTGQKMWNNQPGDYLGYNERFGGLPAFREAVKTYQQMGSLTTLYTDPFRLDENCPTGKAHGKEWCVINQDDKLSTGYEVFNPCHDLPAVRRWVADTMGRVMRETGADGIRLDEYGHRGWACYNPDHQHTYAEPGITQWQKATAEATRMVHEEMDKVRPDLVLTTEFPGYDYMMQYLEGCITYDFTTQATPLRPLECNLQRFYFPECKVYELDHRGADLKDRKKFWNAVESFGRYYPVPYYVILSQNEDAYQGRNVTPLLHTPGNAPQVYVNRFVGVGKALYHLYNASGSTYEGVALAVPVKENQHVYDLLNCEEPGTNEMPGRSETYVHVYIPRNDVACVGVFPRLLDVSREENTLTVKHGVRVMPKGGLWLAVASAEGYNLLVSNAGMGDTTLDLSKLTVEGKPACVKLLDGNGQLLDVVSVPAD
jgi:hypothetical protein